MNSTPATSRPVPGSPMVMPSSLPTKVAVIAPLITTGPVTYETLLADLNDSPIPYQLWLLAQVSPTSESADNVPTPSPPVSAAATLNPLPSDWAVTPSFSPVSGVDATSVAWPNTETPRVITVQYSGLEINQAVNWAIRQAHGDMILVLDHGLSGLLQLRQALGEIRREMQRIATIPNANIPDAISADVIPATPSLSSDLSDAMFDAGNDQPLPGALNRRLVERLEQWGVAMQRQADRSRQHRAARPHHQPRQAATTGLNAGEIAAVEAVERESATINRIDDESVPQPKKLPKFITHFHEFI